MIPPDLSPLVGSLLLDDVRVLAPVRHDDSMVLLQARRDKDGSACTVRVSTALELREQDVAMIESVAARVARHGVGIRALAPPVGAGAVLLAGVRRLFVIHRGEAAPTVADRIASGPPMQLDEVLRLLGPIAEALAALHDQGLVHGAVIPSTIHLASTGASLSAFGWTEIAAVLGGPAAARDILPLRDRSPEQVAIVPAAPSTATDTFGLALVASQLLAGKPFVSPDDPNDVARAIENPMARPTPRALGVSVSDPVEAVFAAALQPQPQERTRDPQVFIAALGNPPESPLVGPAPEPFAAAPEPIAAPLPQADLAAPVPQPPPAQPQHRSAPRPPSFFEPTAVPPQPKSNAWIVYLLVGLGGLLLVGGATAGFYLSLRAPPPPPAVPTTVTPTPTPPPPVTTRPRITVPGPTDPLPGLINDAGVDDEEPEDSSDAAGPSTHLWQRRPDGGTPAAWPDDATALVPIGEHTPVIGTRDALVTIVLFGDLRCPYTRKARQSLERLVVEHGSSVRVAVRLLPMPDNAGADEAARVGAATNLTSDPYTFWHLFELVSESAKSAGTDRESFLKLAERAGASRPTLDKAIQDRRAEMLVDQDVALAGQLMVHGTPTLFVNGRRLNGVVPWNVLETEVEREIVAAKGALVSGVSQARLYNARVLFNVTAGGADREQPER